MPMRSSDVICSRDSSMAAKNALSSRSSSKRKLLRQKQSRRKSNLMRKACEYSKMCEADVCLGIRLRETGQVYILSADPSGFWDFLRSQLVRCQVLGKRQRLTFPGFLLSNSLSNHGPRFEDGWGRCYATGLGKPL